MAISRLRSPWAALTMGLYLWFFFTSPASAGMVGSISSNPADHGMRADEMRRVQLALENEQVRAKLQAYGLTAEEVSSKLDGMSDKQISLLAQASDKVLAGGNGIGVIIGVLVIILLVILILKLLNKRIVIG